MVVDARVPDVLGMLRGRIHRLGQCGLVAVATSVVGMLPGFGLIQELGYWGLLVAMPASLLFIASLGLALTDLRGPVRGQRSVVRMVQIYAGATLLGAGACIAVLWKAGVTSPAALLWALGSSGTLVATLIVGRDLGEWRQGLAAGERSVEDRPASRKDG